MHESRDINLKRKIIPFLSLIWIAIACNLPGQAVVAPSRPTDTRTPAASTILSSRESQTPTPATVRTATHTIPPALTTIRTATDTFLPSDLPFTIDCSALPASRRADCDAFLAATRDRSYPMERELTGVNLSQCYKEIHYIILPTDPQPNAGGISAGDVITYNQRYSIDLTYPYDTHEILHSISSCAGALDLHIFHGMILNAVYNRFRVYEPGYFEDRTSENLNIILEFLLNDVKTAGGAELANMCIGILSRKMTIAYFDLGEKAVTRLYRSTIKPLKNLAPPNAKMVEVWGGYAQQVEALLERIDQEYKYRLDIPECGFLVD
jgi:hypothetical protein